MSEHQEAQNEVVIKKKTVNFLLVLLGLMVLLFVLLATFGSWGKRSGGDALTLPSPSEPGDTEKVDEWLTREAVLLSEAEAEDLVKDFPTKFRTALKDIQPDHLVVTYGTSTVAAQIDEATGVVGKKISMTDYEVWIIPGPISIDEYGVGDHVEVEVEWTTEIPNVYVPAAKLKSITRLDSST